MKAASRRPRPRIVVVIALIAMAFVAMISGVSAQETLVQKLLRIAGLTAAPSQLRGPGDENEPGNVWMAALRDGSTRALTTEGGYLSPVYAGDGTIYALKGDAVVKISPTGSVTHVQRAAGVAKLVGVNRDDSDEMIVLLNATAGAPLATLSLRRGAMTPLPFDPQSDADRKMVAEVRGHDRVYGETTLYTRSEVKQGLSRRIEWTDVYLKRGSAEPVNVSRCDGVNCGQPALSPDGQAAVFVRTGE
jgi:hypothetical protein